MPGITRTHVSDARGASRLLLEGSAGVVNVVERMHRTIQRRPWPVGQPVQEATRGITGVVYRSIRGSMHLLARGLDAGLAPLEGLLPAGESTPSREALVSIVNGVYGDHLARTGNPLAIEMSIVGAGEAPDAAAPTGKLLVLAHGLCMGVQQWTREGYSHGAALADALGYTPLYLRYNSGLHIAENGRLFAEQLESLVAQWPRPVEELTILGHSMGGLVARSACLAAAERQHRWLGSLRRLVFLGTPHHGAPLERGGHGLDYLLGLSPYSAPFTRLGKARSAGIQDLRHGTITAGGHQSVRLPAGVACYAVAATLGERRAPLADRVVGDGLVPLDSALGRHPDRSRALRIPKARRWVGFQMGHLELLHRPEVYSQLHDWLATPAA
jgi:pimeloyl-ACP methyl ester carboxylesterase